MQIVPIFNWTDSGCPNILWCTQGVPIINGTYRVFQYLMEHIFTWMRVKYFFHQRYGFMDSPQAAETNKIKTKIDSNKKFENLKKI